MGWTDEPFFWDIETFMRKVKRAINFNGDRIDMEVIFGGKSQPLNFNGERPIQLKTVFPKTDDAKIHLTPSVLGDRPYEFLQWGKEFPLALISPASSKMITSTLGEFNLPRLLVTINPQDAKQRNINGGEKVRVYNDLGEVICGVDISDKIRKGVVSMPKGAWQKSSLNGKVSTALCPSDVNIVGGGACFNDARVEIKKV